MERGRAAVRAGQAPDRDHASWSPAGSAAAPAQRLSPKRQPPRPATSHANRGKGWERLLELQHARLEATGRAVVFRTPPPVQLLGRLRGGAYRAVPTSEGPPDYVLLLAAAPAPVAVALEAKDCAGSRWALKQLHPHQAHALRRWHALGGLAVVAVRHQLSSTCWLLPWATLGPVWQRWRAGQVAGQPAPRGSASLGLGDLHQLGTPWEQGDGDGYLRALLACAPRAIVSDR